MDQTALLALLGFVPEPYRTYGADVLGIAGLLSLLASLIASQVKPPSTNHAAWVQTLYRVVTWPALNLNWARNAVVPGMSPPVQQAALAAAKLAAAFPAAQVVAPPGVVLAANPVAEPIPAVVMPSTK